MRNRPRRPSPATAIACLALFFAVAGGTAIALQGRNTVDSGDIKPKAVKTSDIANNAVTTKKIKNNHVRAADIQNNAVGTGEIRNGQVRQADLAPAEAFHRIGTAGQPPFGNGGQGDCLWSKFFAPGADPFESPGFYRDPYGQVHLTGALVNSDGPGGDVACDGDDINESIIFTLPPGYRPLKLNVLNAFQFDGVNGVVEQLIVNGDAPVVSGPVVVPPGAVIPFSLGADEGQQVILDGLNFRAAGTNNSARRGALHLSGEAAEFLNRILSP